MRNAAPRPPFCGKKKKQERGRRKHTSARRGGNGEKGGHGHVGSSQPFLGTKKGGIGAQLGENRFEEDHVKSDSSREGSTCGHVRAAQGPASSPVEKERASPLARSPVRDPSSLPLLLVRKRGGQRGIHSCTYSQNATRACECVRYTHGAPSGGPRGETWRRESREYFHEYVNHRDGSVGSNTHL